MQRDYKETIIIEYNSINPDDAQIYTQSIVNFKRIQKLQVCNCFEIFGISGISRGKKIFVISIVTFMWANTTFLWTFGTLGCLVIRNLRLSCIFWYGTLCLRPKFCKIACPKICQIRIQHEIENICMKMVGSWCQELRPYFDSPNDKCPIMCLNRISDPKFFLYSA